MIHNRILSCVALLLLLTQFELKADPQSEARELKDEALSILKKYADIDSPPIEIAKCIFNLEKAANILEAANDSNSDLAVSVNMQLYWARKRSTLAIDKELDKLKASSGIAITTPKKTVPTPPPTAKVEPSTEAADPNAAMSAGGEVALKAYKEAERFAGSHQDDDYLVMMTWFQMASSHPGTDYALKALTFARQAQVRYKAKNSTVGVAELDDSPAMKLVKQGDDEIKAKQYDKAVALFKSSLASKDTPVAHSRLGQAYFDNAMKLKEEFLAKYEPAYQNYRSAVRNATVTRRTIAGTRSFLDTNNAEYRAALAVCTALGKDSSKALDLFNKALGEFKLALAGSKGGSDLIADGMIGICLSQNKSDAFQRSKAKSHLVKFLASYTPKNDDERTVYEFCKSELSLLNGK